jgi:hypothetical protein
MKKNIIITESQLETLINSTKRLIKEKANLSCTSLNYDTLKEELGNRESKKIGHNTLLSKTDFNEIGIRYHSTYIIKIDPTNIIKLDTKGWWTKTTKDRLNQFLNCRGVSIYQEKDMWYIRGNNGTFKYDDGIMVTEDGDIIAV